MIDEIKISYKLTLLGIMIAMMIMSVVVVFIHLTGYIMPAVSRQYDDKLEGGVHAIIQNLPVNDIEVLKQLHAEDINLIVESSVQLSKSVLVSDETDAEISGQYIQCKWFTSEGDNEFESMSGDIDLENFNYAEKVIIYCPADDIGNYREGEYLTLYLNNGTSVNQFMIEAVEEDKDVDSAYAILPAFTVIKDMNDFGIEMSYSYECTIPKASQYIDFKKQLSAYGAICSCDYDEILDLVNLLKTLFMIMAVIFVIISVFVMATIAIININTREKFIVLQSILGATDFRIIAMYTAILELQILAADILGGLLGFGFAQHFLIVIRDLYGIESSVQSISWSMVILGAVVISNIALVPFLFVIRKMINNKDIVSIINNKD